MYDPEFVDIVRSFKFVNHHVGDLAPSGQADSIRDAECEVFMGVIDDRTSVTGILRNVHRLKRQVSQMNPDLVHSGERSRLNAKSLALCLHT